MKELLGGKGAGLAEMTNLKVSVPPGFTISTEACVEYYKRGKAYPPGMMEVNGGAQEDRAVDEGGLWRSRQPVIVSVRSGARASMPGMMDTVLNVGLTTKTVHGLALKTRTNGLRRTVIAASSACSAASSWASIASISRTSSNIKARSRGHARYASRCEGAQGTRRQFQGTRQRETKRDFPDDPARTTTHGPSTRCSPPGTAQGP